MANEKRLIDVNALMADCRKTLMVDVFPNWENMSNEEKNIAVKIGGVFKRMHENAPTVDAVEVVHAHWEDGWGEDCYGNIAYKSIDCSHCEEVFKIESKTREYWKARFKVCPFCGAKMDGGNEDG